MSGTDFLRMILAKYDGFHDFLTYSFTLAPSATGIVSVLMKEPYVTYILDFFAYSSEKELSLSMFDSSSQIIFGGFDRMASLPMPFTFYKLIPENRLYGEKNIIGDYSTEGTFCVEFTNDSSVSADVDMGVNFISILLSQADAFEAELKSFDLGNVKLITKLDEINKNIVTLKDRFKPEFVG